MIRVIKLCMKEMEAKDSKRKFPSYFGYKVEADNEGNLNTVEYPTTELATDGSIVETKKARSFKVSLSEDLESELKKDNKFPYFVEYDDELIYSDGATANFITWDKDKDRKIRLDKNGRKHRVLVLRSIEKYTACPRTAITFDELDDID